MAALLVQQPEPRGHERVVPRSVLQTGVRPVRGDRAVHEPRVAREQRAGVDPEPRRRAGPERLEHDVGAVDERVERVAIGVGAEIELRAPATAQPHVVPRCAAPRVATGWLDLHDVRAVVGEQHAGDRTRDAP